MLGTKWYSTEQMAASGQRISGRIARSQALFGHTATVAAGERAEFEHGVLNDLVVTLDATEGRQRHG